MHSVTTPKNQRIKLKKLNKMGTYRIKEEKYVSGKSKFFAQGYFEEQWRNLSGRAYGFNTNDLDLCTNLDDAQFVIDRFRVALADNVDKVVGEKIYDDIPNRIPAL